MKVESNNNIKCTVALAALENVFDPEIGLNVVDLGLIYQIDFNEELSLVNCTMTLTTPNCPMSESIKENIEHALRECFRGYTIQINLAFIPPWSYERISEAGKEFLNK